ncbi:hypothetical protein RLEG12_25250 [Rhizobium leguminosarum bv. trifolii CB782]|nr:hypothetical protein RLEG12_25250 [Rhizobium leguminosarum bv. trifolii CB782]
MEVAVPQGLASSAAQGYKRGHEDHWRQDFQHDCTRPHRLA